jgi:hypothetical protein
MIKIAKYISETELPMGLWLLCHDMVVWYGGTTATLCLATNLCTLRVVAKGEQSLRQTSLYRFGRSISSH